MPHDYHLFKEAIRRLTKKSSIKTKNCRINILVSFQRRRELQDFLRTQERRSFIKLFSNKTMVAVVTVILAIVHIAARCFSRATYLDGKSSMLACMLTPMFSFVFMATG